MFRTKKNKIIKKYFKGNNILSSILISFFCFSLFTILIKMPYVGDDAYNSQIAGKIIAENTNLIEMILRESVGWLNTGSMRFSFYFYIYPLFYFIKNIEIIKILSIFTIFFSILSFFKFIKIASKDYYFALSASLSIFLLIQLRNSHDPVLGFPSFMIPLICCFGFLSLYLYILSLENKKISYSIISSLLFFLILIMYEISIIFIPIFLVYFITNWKFKNKIYLYYSLPILIAIAIYLIILFFLKFFYIPVYSKTILYSGLEIHTNFYNIFKALKIQLFSTFPLSYILGSILEKKIFLRSIYQDMSFLAPHNIVISILLAFSICLSVYKTSSRKISKNLVLTSIFLIFIPAILISISGHQEHIISDGYGQSYLPVYIQYFGFSILIVYLITKLKSKIKSKILLPILFILITIISLLTQLSNLIATKNLYYLKESYELNKQLYKHDELLRSIEDDFKLVKEYKYPHDYKWNHYMMLNKFHEICSFDIESPFMPMNKCVDTKKNISKPENLWAVAYSIDIDKKKNGAIFLAKIDQVIFDNIDYPIAMITKNLKVYNQRTDSVEIHTNKEIDFMKIIKNETLYRNFDDFKIDDHLAGISWLILGNSNRIEGGWNNYFSWISGDTEIVIYNKYNIKKELKIEFNVFSPSDEKKDIEVVWDGKILITKEFDSLENVKFNFIAKPGKNLIKINTNSKPFDNGDPRKIIYGLSNLVVMDN